ncbi:MAG: hypothetical protein MI923_09825 [Phycisphaerales bacterium]|nr:hypothetical protein [Phycisphaerales bacterium]
MIFAQITVSWLSSAQWTSPYLITELVDKTTSYKDPSQARSNSDSSSKPKAPDDRDRAMIVDALPTLPERVWASMLAIVRAATESGGSGPESTGDDIGPGDKVGGGLTHGDALVNPRNPSQSATSLAH